MSDDLGLDAATVASQLSERAPYVHPSPWHARRALGFGASDVPALLVGLGLRDVGGAPQYIAKNAASVGHARVLGGVPRIVAEKAGVKRPLAAGRAATIGTEREGELLRAWRDSLDVGDVIDPESVQHASCVPRELQASIRDVECPILSCSLDGWCRDVLGDLLVVEIKCGHQERVECPWYWRAQVQAQLACTGLDRGVLVLGQMWARGADVHGPIVAWPIDRDESEIAEIRDAVRRAWAMVELIRGGE